MMGVCVCVSFACVDFVWLLISFVQACALVRA